MQKHKFVSLHNHSIFSLMDGCMSIQTMVKRARDIGMESLGITEHGNMFSAIKFYEECRAYGIKPIIGMEAYIVKDINTKTPQREIAHLVLLAKNITGYKNLVKLSTLGFLQGFYYKPRIDIKMLEEYKDGLIATTACIKGLSTQIDGLDTIDKIHSIFKEDLYIELQVNDIEEQHEINKLLIEYALKRQIKTVLTNDSHYAVEENFATYDLIRALQENKKLDDEDRKLRPRHNNFYMIPPGIIEDKARRLFGNQIGEECIESTKEISNQCNLRLNTKILLPKFPTGSKSQYDTLKDICIENLQSKPYKNDSQYTNRLFHELEIVNSIDFSSYFLIVRDFVLYAKNKGIPVGPGRGSGSGSLICYILGITEIDPIKHGLIFERFINPKRVTMPDLDLDFAPEGREQVIEYIKNKYGKDRVANVGTFSKLGPKAAIKDVARTLDIPFTTANHFTTLVPYKCSTLSEAMENEDFASRYSVDPMFKRTIDLAKGIEGFVRQQGRHAAGIVVAPGDITDYVPLAKIKDNIVCQYDKDDLERIGLLKIDILGLRNLSVISNTIDRVESDADVGVRESMEDLSNPLALKVINSGQTVGIFQFEGSGITKLAKTVGIKDFKDIVNVTALYRPGAMSGDMLNRFIENRHNPNKIQLIHPLLKDLLKDTYGILLFQETIMKMTQFLGGFDESEADTVRRAVAKNHMEILKTLKNKFIEGCKAKHNIDKDISSKIFELIEMGGYLFNLAHAVSYSKITYDTSYLKAHYPLEYMTELITSVMDDRDHMAIYIEEARRMKINILPPDINKSFTRFEIENGSIRFGLNAIKDVNGDSIVDERTCNGEFFDLVDFISRTQGRSTTIKTILSLGKAGALDKLGYSRKQIITMSDNWKHYKKAFCNINGSQFNLFSDDNQLSRPQIPPAIISNEDILEMEKEVLGTYLGEHPLSKYRDFIQENTCWSEDDYDLLSQGEFLRFAGIIKQVRTVVTRKGSEMAFVEIEGLNNKKTVTMFPLQYAKFKPIIKNGQAILIAGNINIFRDEKNITVVDAKRLDDIELSIIKEQ